MENDERDSEVNVNRIGSGRWEELDHLEAGRTSSKPSGNNNDTGHSESDLNESGTSLTLTDSESGEERKKSYLSKCTVRGCLEKTIIGAVAIAVIGGLAYVLEPTYPEINMNTPLSHELCMRLLNESLSAETMKTIETNKYSPQAMALGWMNNDPRLNSYPLWRHRQRFAMVVLYYSMNGVLWPDEDKADWLSYDESECKWHRSADDDDVKVCDDDGMERLERLVFDGTDNFRGKLPTEINMLSTHEISITGMKSQSFHLQDLLPLQDKEAMARLEKINFSNTRLEGTIPDDIEWMFNLREINFSEGGSLEGPIPTQLEQLHKLEILSLQGNQLSGSLPTRLSSSLEQVNLHRNDLTGQIPNDWCSLSNLNSLHLDDNHLEGTIPSCLANLVSHFTHARNDRLIATTP